MSRSTIPALCAALLLAGCGSNGSEQTVQANTFAGTGDEVEALPSDGLAAPEGMPLDSESNVGAPGNAVGSASGGNAM